MRPIVFFITLTFCCMLPDMRGLVLADDTEPAVSPVTTPQERAGKDQPTVILASGVQTYVFEREGKPAGPLYRQMACVLNAIKVPFELQFMPLSRIVRYFAEQKVAGVVPAVEGTRFSEFADWVGPFAVSQSFWFYRANGPRAYGRFDLKKDGVVGTKRESAWRLYLEENGYHIGRYAETVEDAMAMLLAGEVDVILGSDTHRLPGAIPDALMENIKPVPAFDVQFGGYFRRDFLDEMPDRREKLSAAIDLCNGG